MAPAGSKASPADTGRTVAVAVPAPTRRLFVYRVPPDLAGQVVPGVRVRVPLGGQQVTGIVVGEGSPPQGVTLKDLARVLDDTAVLTPNLLALTRWASEHYLASWGATLRAALPAELEARRRSRIRLTEAGRAALEDGATELACLASRTSGLSEVRARARMGGAAGLKRLLRRGWLEREEEFGRPRGERSEESFLVPGDEEQGAAPAARAPARARLVRALRTAGILSRREAASQAGVSAAVIRSALAAGAVREIRQVPETRLAPIPGESVRPETLTADQSSALEAVLTDVRAGRFAVHLLAGVTGSGKTEVYLRAMAEVLDRGGTALLLVPEIGLAPLLARTVRDRFGPVAAVLHSGLRREERLAEWQRVRSGAARVVLGARSAVFAPLEGLGLLVVDEEHEPAYKQEEAPRYHGRDLAVVRARQEGAVAILGSATPSLESWDRAARGRYRLSLLPRRVAERPLPAVEIVDMRAEFQETGATSPLSRRLLEDLQAVVGRGEQAIVLLNRRGYSSFVLCRECGESLECPLCAVNLTYHRTRERLRCHYCGASRPRPATCPACSSPHLHFGGEGTQRVERHLARHLPDLRILRMDRDTVRGKESHQRILTAFEAGRADLLLGTQMVAKGHDFPRVTLVGVLAADGVLGLPDFRAAERTFQLITQVAGRAGRGDRPGRVIVQAFRPGHPAIRAAAAQDYTAFAEREMRYRRSLGYPPCSHVARVLVTDRDPGRALDRAREAAEALKASGEGRLVILGPATAPLARLRGLHRVHLLVRARARGRLVAALAGMLDALYPEGAAPRGVTVDVDPVTLQ